MRGSRASRRNRIASTSRGEHDAGDQRVLLVGSSGGHLAQLLALRSWWGAGPRGWVTFDTPDAMATLSGEESVWWAYHPTTRNVRNLLKNGALARRVMREFKPDVVVSTGAAVAFPFFLFARAAGVTTVFLEVYDRIETPTLTGKLCSPITDLMLVQWPEQARLYPRAVVVGPVL